MFYFSFMKLTRLAYYISCITHVLYCSYNVKSHIIESTKIMIKKTKVHLHTKIYLCENFWGLDLLDIRMDHEDDCHHTQVLLLRQSNTKLT